MIKRIHLLLFVVVCYWPPQAQATPSVALKNAKRYYEAYEFGKAIPLLEQAREEITRKGQRLEVLLLLSLCYYKEARHNKAIEIFERALKLNPKAKVPTYAPNALNFYRVQRQLWHEKKKKKKKKFVKTAKAQPVRSFKSPSKPPFRHTLSFVLYGASIVTVGVGVALQAVALGQASAIDTKIKGGGSALEVSNAYERASETAWGATILWVISGAVVITATGVFIHERTTKPFPTPSSSTSRTKLLVKE